nr:unnamed protein product [Callosobruchus analis]
MEMNTTTERVTLS